MPIGYVAVRYVDRDPEGNEVTHERGEKVEVGAAELETLIAWGILQNDPVQADEAPKAQRQAKQ